MNNKLQSLPLFNEPYKPGDQPYRVCVIKKQPQLDEKQPQQLLQFCDNTTIMAQDAATFTFDQVYVNRISNEDLYKALFKGLVAQFLSGTNHMVQVMGPRHTGKGTITIGTLRNPGLILLIIQEIFNFIEEKFLDSQITVKLTAFQYDETGFRDLLLMDSYAFKPYVQNGHNHLLGVPEVILENYLQAMRVLRIAMVNLAQEQNMTSNKFIERLKRSNLVFELKAEISPTEDVKEQAIISRFKLVKYNGDFDFGLVFKAMADITNKTRKNIEVPFKSVELLDYFRDQLLYANQTILLCANSDSVDAVRLGHIMRQSSNRNQFVQFSIYQQNNMLKDIMSNQKDSLALFVKEFSVFTQQKKERGAIIFKNISVQATALKSILTLCDQISELRYKLNCLYSQGISFQCSKYADIINTEDYKEFYLAKVQLYATEQIQAVNAQLWPFCQEILDELHQKSFQYSQLKKQMHKFSKHVSNQPQLSQFDIQRLVNTNSLQNKLISIFEHRMGYNIVNQIENKYYEIYDELLKHQDKYCEDSERRIEQSQTALPVRTVKAAVPKFFKPQLTSKPMPTRYEMMCVLV